MRKFFNKFISFKEKSIAHKKTSIKRIFYDSIYGLYEKLKNFDFKGYFYTIQEIDSIYVAYSPYYLKKLLKEAKKFSFKPINFIDIGSGKGRVCLYANKYYKFENIYGIEIDRELSKISKKNYKKTNYRNINFINKNCLEFKIPNNSSYIFMFNPFNEKILKQFILNNIKHFKKYNSILIYANPIHFKILEDIGFKKYNSTNCFGASFFIFPK